MSGEQRQMINDTDPRHQIGRQPRQIGGLGIGDNPDTADPRGMVADGTQAIAKFIAARPAVRVGGVGVAAGVGLVAAALGGMRRIGTVDPSDDSVDARVIPALVVGHVEHLSRPGVLQPATIEQTNSALAGGA